MDQPKQQSSALELSTPFTDFKGLTARVPYSARTLRELVKKGLLPSIRLPRARRLIFDIAAVDAALRRHTKGVE